MKKSWLSEWQRVVIEMGKVIWVLQSASNSALLLQTIPLFRVGMDIRVPECHWVNLPFATCLNSLLFSCVITYSVVECCWSQRCYFESYHSVTVLKFQSLQRVILPKGG